MYLRIAAAHIITAVSDVNVSLITRTLSLSLSLSWPPTVTECHQDVRVPQPRGGGTSGVRVQSVRQGS